MSASDESGTEREGRIVASYGRRVVVEDSERIRFNCILRGRRLRPVCVDDVRWIETPGDGDDGLVTSLLARRTALARPDRRGRTEVIAANMTQVVVVVAPKPSADLGLVDRYLAAAELAGVNAAIVANKNDLQSVDLEEFARIGYPVLSVSARSPEALQPLRDLLRDQTSIFTGQSGVGKSSLLNTLIPGLDARTRALSESSGEGRHTTTASMLHHLEHGGEVIDSPGVRDYAPPPVDERQLASGFREFRKPSEHCKFADCRHLAEPRCAVKDAIEKGQISPRRYNSYRQLLRRHADLRRSTDQS